MNDDLAGLIESFADIGQPLGLIRVLRALAERIEQLEARVDDTRAVAVLHHAGCTRRDNDLRAELDNMRAAVMGEFEVLRGADLRDALLDEASLEGAFLSGANLRGALLEGADLEGALLEGGPAMMTTQREREEK